jgi:predicted amidophosphoribosyltransferase
LDAFPHNLQKLISDEVPCSMYFVTEYIEISRLLLLKGKSSRKIMNFIGDLLGKAIISAKYINFSNIDLVIPITSSKKNITLRSFDHTYELANALVKSNKFFKNCCVTPIIKNADALEQKLRNQKDRLKAPLKNIFVDPENKSLLTNKSILLIDDVISTGATIHACINKIGEISKPKSITALCYAFNPPRLR